MPVVLGVWVCVWCAVRSNLCACATYCALALSCVVLVRSTLSLVVINSLACVLGGVSGSGCVGCVSVALSGLCYGSPSARSGAVSGGSAVSGCVAVGLCAVIIYLQLGVA